MLDPWYQDEVNEKAITLEHVSLSLCGCQKILEKLAKLHFRNLIAHVLEMHIQCPNNSQDTFCVKEYKPNL